MKIPAWLLWLTGGIAVAGMLGWFISAIANPGSNIPNLFAVVVAPAIVVFFVLLFIDTQAKPKS